MLLPFVGYAIIDLNMGKTSIDCLAIGLRPNEWRAEIVSKRTIAYSKEPPTKRVLPGRLGREYLYKCQESRSSLCLNHKSDICVPRLSIHQSSNPFPAIQA